MDSLLIEDFQDVSWKFKSEEPDDFAAEIVIEEIMQDEKVLVLEAARSTSIYN
jgi:hypothetical protein